MTTAVEKKKTVQDIIRSEAMLKQFATALPKVCTPDRFARVAVTTINKTPKLAQCSQMSLFACLMDCAALGIEPDGRRAYLIPYGQEAKLIIGYQGLIELARRSGEVSLWKAELVCDKDVFSYENGMVHHKINWRDPRGNVYAVYSIVKFKDGTIDYEIMQLSEIEAIRDRSKSGKSGPWQTDFLEMAKKTVIRRHAKRMPLSSEFRDALEKDEDTIQPMKQAEVVVDTEAAAALLLGDKEEVIEGEVIKDEVPQ